MSETNNRPIAVGEKGFDELLQTSDKPVLVDFWAEWCAPCRMVGPVIDQVAKTYAERATVAKVDVEAHPALARRFNVRSIPTVMLFNDGEATETLVGVRPADDYAAAIESALA